MRGFRFAEFDALCAELGDDELQLKWQHYTRALTSASTSTSVAVLAAGPTGGVSMIGAMIAGPLLHNARRKRQMVGRHMRARGLEPETRRKDVYVPLAIGGALGAATMGVGTVGAEALAVEALADKTLAKVVLHTALDVGATAGEERHLRHEHRKERKRRFKGSLRPARASLRGQGEGGEEDARADPKYGVAGALRPSRSSVVEVEGDRFPYQPENAQQQQPGVPLLRPSRSFEEEEEEEEEEDDEDTFSDLEYTMAGALRSSASVISEDDRTYQFPEKQRDHHVGTLTTCPQAFMEKYPLISEYITSSDVSGQQAGPAGGAVDASMIAGLLGSFDEDTLAELERDLEQAVEDMDGACEEEAAAAARRPGGSDDPFEDVASVASSRQTARTFEEPSDLDSLVRRHSVLYTSKARRRTETPSILMDEAPPAYRPQDFPDRPPELTDRKAGSARRHEDAGPTSRSNSMSTLASVSSASTMPPRYEHLRHPSTVSSMSTASSSYHQPTLSPASSVSTMPTGYDRPAYYCRSTSDYSTATAESHLSASSWTSRVASSAYQGSDKDSYGRPTSPGPPRSPSQCSQSEYSTADSESRFSTKSRTSTMASRASSAASTTHRGLAKTGYLGLGTATKLAVGGSLCLVGVRPSVQRKMLDKAKGKISDAREARRADDDYRDYA